MPKTIFIIAGEASGDMHAANLVRAISEKDPSIRFVGMGGQKLQNAGVEIIQKNNLSFIGLTEVILNLPAIYKVFQKVKNYLLQQKPDLVILVDYPSFNLRMAKIAKNAGLKVFYYISPQLWAWHQSRIKIVKKYIDVMAVVFPFEVDFYNQFGVNAKFVGHPLTNTIKPSFSKEEAKNFLGINNSTIAVTSSFSPQSSILNPIVGLLPGSRRGEIKRLLPVMIKAAELIKQSFPEAQFVLPLASTLTLDDLNLYLTNTSLAIKIISGHNYDVIDICDAVIVTSGTATLEVALLQVPMAIIYKVSWLTYFLGRLVIKVPYLGIANIIAGEEVSKEFLQQNAKPELIAAEIIQILSDTNYRNQKHTQLAAIKDSLQNKSVKNPADLVLSALSS